MGHLKVRREWRGVYSWADYYKLKIELIEKEILDLEWVKRKYEQELMKL